jgi:hypothetical protein
MSDRNGRRLPAVSGGVRRVGIGLCLSLLVTGCQLIDRFADPPVYVDLEIHNRTVDALTFENAEGQRVEVPACESVTVESFAVDAVTVRAPGGYVRGFGAGGDPSLSGERMHLIEVPSAQDSGIPIPGPAPEALPPCEGHAEAQPGT